MYKHRNSFFVIKIIIDVINYHTRLIYLYVLLLSATTTAEDSSNRTDRVSRRKIIGTSKSTIRNIIMQYECTHAFMKISFCEKSSCSPGQEKIYHDVQTPALRPEIVFRSTQLTAALRLLIICNDVHYGHGFYFYFFPRK